MDPHQVIIRPVISEKSYNLIETQNQYTFQVDKRANKNQIKRAIEDAFDGEAEELLRSHARLGYEGEAGEGPDRQTAQVGRAQQQRAHHDPPHRRRA